jgi:hypothetical protein
MDFSIYFNDKFEFVDLELEDVPHLRTLPPYAEGHGLQIFPQFRFNRCGVVTHSFGPRHKAFGVMLTHFLRINLGSNFF